MRPSDSRVGGSGETSRMRSVRFSPYWLGMEARRRSTTSPLDSSNVVRPSCGSRRSAMFMLPMILRRLVMPGCSSLGNSRRGCSTPSMRQRTCSDSSRGSRWMSDAFMLAASASRASTSSMMSASTAPPVAHASSPSSRASLSLPRVLKWMATASSKPLSVQMTGTTRRLVRMLTSSMAMTSSGLVMARCSAPSSSTRSGMSLWRTMKSRDSRLMAAGSGDISDRSATPMCICPATAVTISCSVSRPLRTRTSPRRPPSCPCSSRARSSCWRVRRPLAASSVPSLRRPAERCLRPLASASMRARRSSASKGLVMNSAAPMRCAFSKVP